MSYTAAATRTSRRSTPDAAATAVSSCTPDSILWGDVTLDGGANIIDAQQIARYTVSLSVAQPAALQFVGDVTGDSTVNIVDAQQVARSSVGLTAAARVGTFHLIPVSAASITVSPGSSAVQVGDSLALMAIASDSIGRPMGDCAALTWASSDTSSVTVTSLGIVRVNGPGTPVVSASSGFASGSATVMITTSATTTRTVSGTDTTSVTVPSGANLSIPPGALPAGTVVKLADAGTDQRAGSHQVGASVLLTVTPPAGVAAASALAKAALDAAPSSYAALFTVSGSPSALTSSGLSAAFTFPGTGNTPNTLYSRDLTINPVADPLRSLVKVSLNGVPKWATQLSLRIDRVSSPLECAPAREFKDPDLANASQVVDPNRIPLILIHGWQPDKADCADFYSWSPRNATWGVLYPKLTAAASGLSQYQIWVMRYPTNRPIIEAAQYLKQEIDARFGVRDVVIVAHSMGGVVATKYLSDNPSAAVSQLITLATPFQGSVLADVIAHAVDPSQVCAPILSSVMGLFSAWTPYPFTEGVADLRPGSTVYSNIRASHGAWWAKTSVYVGEFQGEPAGKILSMANWIDTYGDCIIANPANPLEFDRSDGVVPSRSASDPTWGAPVESATFKGVDHLGMPNARAPVAAVIARLKALAPAGGGLPCTGTAQLGCGLALDQFSLILAGTFQMGSTAYAGWGEEPVHAVTISRAFYMQKTEVTQGQWRAVMGSNPSYFPTCGDTCPVEQVSWNDIQTYIQQLNASTGVTYRLPTEAEWEYAARAGTTGETYGTLDDIAWYDNNSASKTHAAAGKQANAWGLYDMFGNVWERVNDWYGAYSSAAVTDPTGPATGDMRMLRGGTFDNPSSFARAAFRHYFYLSGRSANLGFRLVRTP